MAVSVNYVRNRPGTQLKTERLFAHRYSVSVAEPDLPTDRRTAAAPKKKTRAEKAEQKKNCTISIVFLYLESLVGSYLYQILYQLLYRLIHLNNDINCTMVPLQTFMILQIYDNIRWGYDTYNGTVAISSSDSSGSARRQGRRPRRQADS